MKIGEFQKNATSKRINISDLEEKPQSEEMTNYSDIRLALERMKIVMLLLNDDEVNDVTLCAAVQILQGAIEDIKMAKNKTAGEIV